MNKLTKTTIKYIAPWLAAAAIGGAIALAPIASADTNPLVPYGTNPHAPIAGVPRIEPRRSQHHERLRRRAVLIHGCLPTCSTPTDGR